MTEQTGNLSDVERAISAVLGLTLSVFILRQRSPALRTLAGVAAAGMAARAFAGHCGVKAAVAGHTSLREGMADQWRRMARPPTSRYGLAGSPAHASKSDSVDESVDESFPASDPPASRLPDVPPSNAEAKWAAARAAERDRNGRDGGWS